MKPTDTSLYQKTVLDNGIRVISEELPFFHSVALGVWVTAGSRDETAAEGGLSHFLEHMAFKGTARRRALNIAQEIDQVGGSCNAFTTKENTCFHGRVLADNLPRLVDLLIDLALNSRLEAPDLDLERQVILEEIAAQDDNPEDLAQVEFGRNFWGESSFGRPILGEAADVSRFDREDLLAFRNATYRPESLIVAAAGRVKHQELLDLATRSFEQFANGAPLRSRSQVATHPGVYRLTRDLEQVHVCLGTLGPTARDRRRYEATLLNLILGGNMSSRLFQVVREKLGLAYNIYSFLSFFSDTGLWGIGAGVSPRNLEPLMAAVRQELKRLKDETVSDAELRAAQDFFRGSIFLSAEDCEHRMLRLAKNEIHFGHYISLEEIITGLLQVTRTQIRDLAAELLEPKNWALTMLGPVDGAGEELDF
jgi:predicted Zn-dependent peptidase